MVHHHQGGHQNFGTVPASGSSSNLSARGEVLAKTYFFVSLKAFPKFHSKELNSLFKNIRTFETSPDQFEKSLPAQGSFSKGCSFPPSLLPQSFPYDQTVNGVRPPLMRHGTSASLSPIFERTCDQNSSYGRKFTTFEPITGKFTTGKANNSRWGHPA